MTTNKIDWLALELECMKNLPTEELKEIVFCLSWAVIDQQNDGYWEIARDNEKRIKVAQTEIKRRIREEFLALCGLVA